jgi:rhodanese-related sulfurtransferase
MTRTKNLISKAILLITAVGLTAGCTGKQLTVERTVVENTTKSNDVVDGYRNLTPDQAYLFMQESKSIILDVRTLQEYERSHLESAELIPLGELDKRVDELREQFADSDIIVYCQTGNRSKTAAKLLAENGFSRIINMRGGLKAWVVKNFPVVTSNSTAE